MFRLHGKKIIKILRTKILLNWTYAHNVPFQGLHCEQNQSLYKKSTMYNILTEIITSDDGPS